MTDLMKGVVEIGTAKKARELGRPAAGKTGTSTNYRDAWFFGFTTDLLCGVWVGRDDFKPVAHDATGGQVALPIWLAYMKEAEKGRPVRDFAVPAGRRLRARRSRQGRAGGAEQDRAVASRPSGEVRFLRPSRRPPRERVSPMSNSDDCAAPTDAAVADATRVRGRAVRRVFIITLVLNAAVAVVKAIYGYVSHSLSVGTDSLHSILDASRQRARAARPALVGRARRRAPPLRPAQDRDPRRARHRRAHRHRMFEFAVAAVRSLLGHAPPPQIGIGGFVVVIATMVVNALVARYEHRKAHELGSTLLHADAHHTRSDLYASGAVLASFLAVRAGFVWADGVATLVLVALVSHVAWEVFSENVPILIDTAILDPAGVVDVARGMPGVRDVHRVRSRGVRHAVELDLHLQVGADMSLRDAHALSREIEAQLRVKFPELSDVVIHIEPAPVPDAATPLRLERSDDVSIDDSTYARRIRPKKLRQSQRNAKATRKGADSESLTPSATPIRLRIRFRIRSS